MAALGTTLEAPAGWRAWWLAARPRTLPLALAPVAVGTALAQAHEAARLAPALAALAGALLIQVGTNFANDLFDAEKGADTAERIGPPRAVQMGWVSPARMRVATALAFAGASLAGVYLVALGGWPIALAGVLSIAAGLAYTAGPFPLGYRGLGDAAVFLFFGLVAVCGSYYVQALALPAVVVATSLPVGALATAVLVVNNLRDAEGDRRAGKRTLVVRWGRRAGRLEYVLLLLTAYAVPPGLWITGTASPAVLLPLATAPAALRLARVVGTRADGPAMNDALAGTARLALGFALLLAAGLLV